MHLSCPQLCQAWNGGPSPEAVLEADLRQPSERRKPCWWMPSLSLQHFLSNNCKGSELYSGGIPSRKTPSYSSTLTLRKLGVAGLQPYCTQGVFRVMPALKVWQERLMIELQRLANAPSSHRDIKARCMYFRCHDIEYGLKPRLMRSQPTSRPKE